MNILPRIIPTLLLKNKGLVKGVNFKNHKYIGDPINAVKIFNNKEVDELVFYDISARENGELDFKLIKEIASEAFMPFAYGGGISSIQEVEKLFNLGVEKVILNSNAFLRPELVYSLSKEFGAQSIVVCIDVGKTILGYKKVFIKNGTIRTKENPLVYAKLMEDQGAGEIILNSIYNEGKRTGYDIELIKEISSNINIPVVASGGARGVHDFNQVLNETEVTGAAAGTIFVFQQNNNGILITYPNLSVIEKFNQ